MTSLPVAANLAQVASLAFPIIAGGWGLWRAMEKKQADQNTMLLRLSDKLDFIHGQFGPNGGGLRQAVNEMSSKIDKIEERQITVVEKVARLEGEFEQHLAKDK
jgi:hypothetical protein